MKIRAAAVLALTMLLTAGPAFASSQTNPMDPGPGAWSVGKQMLLSLGPALLAFGIVALLAMAPRLAKRPGVKADGQRPAGPEDTW